MQAHDLIQPMVGMGRLLHSPICVTQIHPCGSKAFLDHAELAQPKDLQEVNQYLKTFDLIDEQIYLVN